ncbi:gamma-glutamylcyclotransferase-like [Babylonia areolata]|uniref:gamma-glutamylcyclotransferase-like n=1 Tax=Babylonia areolata TaxID=304850 RepID=UPI003FCF7271
MASATFFFYFAYGSNLLRERLILRNPSAQFTAVAKLTDYKLIFVGNGSRWQGGAANIQEAKGSEVWGAVWHMDTKDIPSLDRQEGRYTAMEVDVRDPKGETFRCRTYQLRCPGHWAEPSLPSPQYKDVIVRGARQNGLPEEYVRGLEGLPDNGFSGELAVYNEVMALLNAGGDGAGGSVSGDGGEKKD